VVMLSSRFQSMGHPSKGTFSPISHLCNHPQEHVPHVALEQDRRTTTTSASRRAARGTGLAIHVFYCRGSWVLGAGWRGVWRRVAVKTTGTEPRPEGLARRDAVRGGKGVGACGE